jgi:hypothetical protein
MGLECGAPCPLFWVPLLLSKVYGIKLWCSLPLGGQKVVIENINNKNSIQAMSDGVRAKNFFSPPFYPIALAQFFS